LGPSPVAKEQTGPNADRPEEKWDPGFFGVEGDDNVRRLKRERQADSSKRPGQDRPPSIFVKYT
jgi:hypothetical protein